MVRHSSLFVYEGICGFDNFFDSSLSVSMLPALSWDYNICMTMG